MHKCHSSVKAIVNVDRNHNEFDNFWRPRVILVELGAEVVLKDHSLVYTLTMQGGQRLRFNDRHGTAKSPDAPLVRRHNSQGTLQTLHATPETHLHAFWLHQRQVALAGLGITPRLVAGEPALA